MLLSLFSDPLTFGAFALSLIIGISVHEFAHAFVAERLGDPTARYLGRVTLNPLAHLDPLGTLFLLIAGFGWGKPVPVNPQYFARPVLDEILVALAGPASNLVTAALIGFGLRLSSLGGPPALLAVAVLQINLVLMLFNLLPIPPLDGSRVLKAVLDPDMYHTLQRFSFPLMIILFVALQSTGLGSWLGTTVEHLTRFLLGI